MVGWRSVEQQPGSRPHLGQRRPADHASTRPSCPQAPFEQGDEGAALTAEAQKAAALAGEAYAAASRAQALLDQVARSASRSGPPSPTHAAYGAAPPPPAYGLGAALPPAGAGPASPPAPLSAQTSAVFMGPCNVSFNSTANH